MNDEQQPIQLFEVEAEPKKLGDIVLPTNKNPHYLNYVVHQLVVEKVCLTYKDERTRVVGKLSGSEILTLTHSLIPRVGSQLMDAYLNDDSYDKFIDSSQRPEPSPGEVRRTISRFEELIADVTKNECKISTYFGDSSLEIFMNSQKNKRKISRQAAIYESFNHLLHELSRYKVFNERRADIYGDLILSTSKLPKVFSQSIAKVMSMSSVYW